MENTKLASDQQRITNWLVDGVIIYFIYSVIKWYLLKGWVVFAIIYFLYYLVSESISGRTIGKLLSKTKVVSGDSLSPKSSAIILRSLFRLIPFEFFSFLGSKNPIGWHDEISKTRVVKING